MKKVGEMLEHLTSESDSAKINQLFSFFNDSSAASTFKRILNDSRAYMFMSKLEKEDFDQELKKYNQGANKGIVLALDETDLANLSANGSELVKNKYIIRNSNGVLVTYEMFGFAKYYVECSIKSDKKYLPLSFESVLHSSIGIYTAEKWGKDNQGKWKSIDYLEVSDLPMGN